MRILLFLALVGTLTTTAKQCKSPRQVTAGETFNLSAGETVQLSASDWALTFTGISEDSRCPEYTNCVWEGQVSASLTISSGGATETITLTQKGKGKDAATQAVAGHTISLLQVSPYPTDGSKIKAEQYSLSVQIVN